MTPSPPLSLHLSAYGVGGLLVVVAGTGEDPDPHREQRWRSTQDLATALRSADVGGLVDVVATYDSLFLELDPARVDHATLAARVREIHAGLTTADPAARTPVGRTVEVPVVLGGAAGPDLDDVAAAVGLTPADVVARLVAAPWTVRFVASPVGSPFAERGDWQVDVPRLGSPRVAVPPGSVALSGAQAMIYPVASPGGWRLVGRTPAHLLTVSPEGPSVPYAAGDRIRFVPRHEAGWSELVAPATAPSPPAPSPPAPARPEGPATRARSGGRDRVGRPPLLRVLEAGRATLQDLGRPGLGHLGVAVNGAADRGSATLANLLVGNPTGATLLELTASGTRLRAEADLLLAVTGAPALGWTAPTVDGALAPVGEPVLLRTGSVLTVPVPRSGLRTYVAVAGGLEHHDDPGTGGGSPAPARRVAGSVAPDAGLGVAGLLGAGDALAAGACVCGWQPRHDLGPVFRVGGTSVTGGRSRVQVAAGTAAVVEVTAGPERDRFDPGSLLGPWTVSAASDHVGLRLEGAPPRRTGEQPGGEARSRGVPVGAVEVPPTDGLLVLLPGRLVTAGYPVPLVATAAGLDVLGQARPGDLLVLREVTDARAREQRRRRDTAYAELGRRVRTALTASGLEQRIRPTGDHPVSGCGHRS